MKRVLLLGFILAICILAMPQGVSAATTGTGDVIVDANIVESIIFSVNNTHMGTLPWLLYLESTNVGGVWQGPTNTYLDAITFNVDSNTPFDINVVETSGDGKMSANKTPSIILNDPITVEKDVMDTYATVSGSSANIVSNKAAAPSGTIFDRNLQQKLEDNDVRLADDFYKIQLTFNCIPYVL